MEAAVANHVESDCELIEYPVKTEGRPKRFYLFRGDDVVSASIRTARTWEYDLAARIYKMTARGGSFVEVGANLGTDTILASDFFRKCYAFEPLDRNLDVLHKNLELNQIHNVKVFQQAVSSQCGVARLYCGNHHNSGTGSLHPSEPGMETYFKEVETVTLDSALPDLKDVTYLHIDAEGHDLKVLQGAKQFIRRQVARPFIKMEFQPATMRLHGSHVSELIEFMEEFGYSAGINASGNMAQVSPGILIDMFYLWKKTKGWLDIYLAPE